MKLIDLANLVTVRNHILNVVNDRSLVNKEDGRILHNVRVSIDKKFVQGVKDLKVDELDDQKAMFDAYFERKDALKKYQEDKEKEVEEILPVEISINTPIQEQLKLPLEQQVRLT